MNLFWITFLPAFFVLAVVLGLSWALRLRFFSKEARDFNALRSDLKELSIEEFESLLHPSSKDIAGYSGNLTPRQRRTACADRLQFIRNCLHIILWNAALFEQLGRAQINQAAVAAGEMPIDENDLGFKILDHAAMCHFMAAICLAKLQSIELCRIAWPFYIPQLTGLSEVRGNNLVAWYQELVDDVLQLAGKDERSWLHGDIRFRLTGLKGA